MPLQDILNDLHADFERWTDESRQQQPTIDIVWNRDIDRFRSRNSEENFQIKWIVVGHNPGEQERGTRSETGLCIGRYFHPNGSTGSWTRLILAHDVDSVEDEVLFLEKTPICSGNIAQLNNKKSHPLFEQMQERMAKAIHDIQEVTQASVWIQGHSSLEDNLFATFFPKLSGFYANTAVASARKNKVFKTYHMGKLMRNGAGFPIEPLFEEGLARALLDVEGFERLG